MALWRLKRSARAASLLILLPLFSLANLFGGAAQAADSLYEVAKLSVDTTAADAVAARKMGMAEAEMRAVKIVLQRLVPLSAQELLPELSQEDVEGLVNGVSIRKEQNSTTRYIATLDVSVNEQGIKQLLQDQGIPYGEGRAPSISILPLVIAGGSVTGGGGDVWRQAWEDLDLTHSMTPATILRPRPDLGLDTVKAVLAGDAQVLESMQADYGYGPLVIAVGETVNGEFVTRLAGADSVGAINFGRRDALGGDAKAAARSAAATAFAIIENRWKVTQSGETPTTEVKSEEGTEPGAGSPPKGEVPRNVVAEVEFSGLKDWQDMRGRLMNVAGIQALEVNSLSARAASITFDYAGSLGRLQKELDQNGFVFDEREGTFVLRSR
ncbi:MAG TPA: DUF2066 domain-containing protein [Methyloceanibacter sp.]|jgi:hypothetical protein